MITVETRLQPGNLSPRASSWSEPSVMDTHEMWTTEQVNELLTSIDTGSGDPASPLDSNYTYVSAQTYNPPHVVLSPSWSLPRRQVGGDNNSALASLQQYQANNPLPDMSGLNVVSASGTSDSHSPMLSTPDMSGMLLGQSPPDMPAYHPFTTAQPHSVPFSAPAETYDFEGLDLFAQHQADLLQADHTQRQSSWPLSPPPLSTPSPLPQHMRAGTLPPEPPSAPPHIFGRRRSISMSGMELQAPVAVTASQTSSTGPVRPKPNRNRSASNLSHHRPTNQAQRTPGGSDSLYSVPRSPSAKERRAVASKRRATLQSVVSPALKVLWTGPRLTVRDNRSLRRSCPPLH